MAYSDCRTVEHEPAREQRERSKHLVTLFLCGDVMTGRGIDQILPHPNAPGLHEPYVQSAHAYVRLAEARNGPIARPVDYAYIWGDALAEFERRHPDVRSINLETAVTKSDAWVPKGINYRMHPDNIGCITAARIDCCVLANNHSLDYGISGLSETLDTLAAAGVTAVGAGRDRRQAETPAVFDVEHAGRVLVFAYGAQSSGIPPDWAAGEARPGINVLADLTERESERIAQQVHQVKRPGDLAVVSLHWGGNWGYTVAHEAVRFAHRLIDEADVDVLYGHSSHHPKGIEVYRGRLILYGCGDFIDDYEGIGGYEPFRNDLGLMYFATVEASTGTSSTLVSLEMVPTQLKRLRVNRAARQDAHWIKDVLDSGGQRFGTWSELRAEGTLALRWAGDGGDRG
jgi:poly-gamma-glutamate capsule biosynthesis protein CapA/YwtB (metallophosphatase superfamily)